MKRSIGEWLLSAATVAVLLLVLLFVYDPVRDDTRRAITKPTAEISSVVSSVRRQAESITMTARETARSHSELTVFAIAAVVLFGFMLRT